MTKSKGVKGLPKVTNAVKVLFELYVTLDVNSPYCLFGDTIISRAYAFELRRKVRWLRMYLDNLEQGADELLAVEEVRYGCEVVEQHQPAEQLGDRNVFRREGDSLSEVAVQEELFEEEQGREEASKAQEASVAAYETEGE